MDQEPSQLRYSASGEPVRLGDRVRVKRFLRKPLEGTVYYLPGKSSPHPEMEYDGIRQWAIRLDNGDLLLTIYEPERPSLDRRFELIERGPEDFQGLSPSERTQEDDYYEEEADEPER